MEILAFLLETVTLRTKQLASQIKVLRIYVGKSFGGEDGKEMWDLGGESGAFSPPSPLPPRKTILCLNPSTFIRLFISVYWQAYFPYTIIITTIWESYLEGTLACLRKKPLPSPGD